MVVVQNFTMDGVLVGDEFDDAEDDLSAYIALLERSIESTRRWAAQLHVVVQLSMRWSLFASSCSQCGWPQLSNGNAVVTRTCVHRTGRLPNEPQH
jgi:hypothetical protein